MQVAFAAAEAAPFAKVGGLADVAGSLPQALARLGCSVTLYVPLHGTIDRAKWGISAEGDERSVPYGASHVRVAYPAIEREGVRIVFVAIARADIVSTVSPRYAKEILTAEFGEGLEGLLQQRKADVRGIVNGIDTEVFDPSRDPHIAAPFSADDRRGKAACKAALQTEGGL